MTDFPNNFDFVLYGTGTTESIISAALSTTGHSVLHIDRNVYYGGYCASQRFGELLENLNIWQQPGEEEELFVSQENYVKHVRYDWFVKSGSNSTDIVNGNSEEQQNETEWTVNLLKIRLRLLDIELVPRLILCESETVDAFIQSDVKRYLEFQFVTKFSLLSENNKVIMVPINRADIVKTKQFSLRQKRQLTSFLEWCFSVSLDNDLVLKYSGLPLKDLLTNERNLDEFTQRVIIDCLVLSSRNTETVEGLKKLKRLLLSFNKVGPYPIIWPNYGSGEISQAFCRMSAVFGGVYSLNTSIQRCSLQESSQNGEVVNENPSNIPIQHRKLKLTLSNGVDIYTDRLYCHKTNINSSLYLNPDNIQWVCRCVLITNKSLIPDLDRKLHDILLLPIHINEEEMPIVLLELPIGHRHLDVSELYLVHITLKTRNLVNPYDLFKGHIDQLFDQYDTNDLEQAPTHKPEILFQTFFALPELSDVDVDVNSEQLKDISEYCLFVSSCIGDLEFDPCFKEAEALFRKCVPAEVHFLPPPPDPEDIIQVGNEAIVPSAGDTSPFTDAGEYNSGVLPEISPRGAGVDAAVDLSIETTMNVQSPSQTISDVDEANDSDLPNEILLSRLVEELEIEESRETLE